MKLRAPRHPKTKQELIGGYNPLRVLHKPFGYNHTRVTRPTATD